MGRILLKIRAPNLGTGADWKVRLTRRLESLRYGGEGRPSTLNPQPQLRHPADAVIALGHRGALVVGKNDIAGLMQKSRESLPGAQIGGALDGVYSSDLAAR